MAYLQLPAAFRSLSRLSSALSAKASALRSYSLNLLSFDLLEDLSSSLLVLFACSLSAYIALHAYFHQDFFVLPSFRILPETIALSPFVSCFRCFLALYSVFKVHRGFVRCLKLYINLRLLRTYVLNAGM